MSSVVRLALHPEEDAKMTPLEVLRDFADATSGWVYLEENSRHYTDVKGTPGLIIRRRIDSSTYVDLGFVGSASDPEVVGLAVLDRPGSDTPLSREDRRALLDTFLDAIGGYLDERPDQVTLEVERERPDPTAE